jgi:Tfp pilus assembly protein FimV
MMPYDTYRLHQIERAKSPAEVRRADEQAARLASAASSLFRGITRPWRAMRRPSPAATRDLPARLTRVCPVDHETG